MLKRPLPPSAGDLTKRATLLEPHVARDADGQLVQGWIERGTVWCHVLPLRGGESVMAARMQSRSPAIVTLRASGLSRQVTSEWRLRIGGREYHAKEDPRETQDRAWLEMLAEG